MAKKKPTWTLPDWQRDLLLTALDDHELVMQRLAGHLPSSHYFQLVKRVRENLKGKPIG